MTGARRAETPACNEGRYEVAGKPRKPAPAARSLTCVGGRASRPQAFKVDQLDGFHRVGRFRLGQASCPCAPGDCARLSTHGLSGRFVLSMRCGAPFKETPQ